MTHIPFDEQKALTGVKIQFEINDEWVDAYYIGRNQVDLGFMIQLQDGSGAWYTLTTKNDKRLRMIPDDVLIAEWLWAAMRTSNSA